MPGFPVDVVDGVLDYAAIGVSAIAAIGTLLAVGVAVWQTNRSREDADEARRETTRLRIAAAAREERHHREIVAMQEESARRERAAGLDAVARDAAAKSGAEKAHLTIRPLPDHRSGPAIVIDFWNGLLEDVSLSVRVNNKPVSEPVEDGTPRTWFLVPSRKAWRTRHNLSAEELAASAAGRLEVDAFFDDSLGNHWRVDHLDQLFLSQGRFIGIETAPPHLREPPVAVDRPEGGN